MTASLWLFGLLVGMRHALEPDHLAAVSTLVVRHRGAGSGAMLGSLWGVGHTLSLLLVATLLALAGAVMPPRLETFFELAVAFMLVWIGIRSITRARREHAHTRAQAHSHSHSHADVDDGVRVPRWAFARRSLLIGSIHGLAGSGALMALVASRLPSTPDRLFYVALFGLGSVMGMAALSGAAGWPLSRLGRSPRAARILTAGTGLVAFGLGIAWGLPLVRDLLT